MGGAVNLIIDGRKIRVERAKAERTCNQVFGNVYAGLIGSQGPLCSPRQMAES